MKPLIRTSFVVLAIVSLCYRAVGFAAGPYTEYGDTVYDSETRLTWQKIDYNVERRSWDEAISHCEDLYLENKADWRLPNIRELITLVDVEKYNPAINPVFEFMATPYWSSTTSRYRDSAWGVHFYHGDDFRSMKTYKYYVRCVRGGFK